MNALMIMPWSIECRDAENRSYRESIFSQANGYMGTRGYRPDQRGEHQAWRSTFLAGFFEYIRPGITDMVNLPDFSGLYFSLNGMDSENHSLSDFEQILDMKTGLLTWRYILTDANGNRTRICFEKLLSMKDHHLAAIRLRITPLNWSGEAMAWGGIDGDVRNLPISDDQLTDNTEFVQLWSDITCRMQPSGGILTAVTKTSRRSVVMGYTLRGDGVIDTEILSRSVVTTLSAELREGVTWTVEKKMAVGSCLEGDAASIVEEKMQRLQEYSFDGMLTDSAATWALLWYDTDIEIDGNNEWQGGIRYNIFQLIQAMPYHADGVGIGARGLTHGRYKGCYFWDMEVFMLPFFIYTQPKAAKKLLMYRYRTLPDACASARAYNLKGARYSWMSSDTGFEQCETWDTGCCEIHITADVAHAVCEYIDKTGDEVFLKDYGAEILIETARYWTERFTYAKEQDCYHLLFVKGPDEYCGVTVDDFYTVALARDNLEEAAKIVDKMRERYPDEWNRLCKKVCFDAVEPLKWREIAEKSVLVRDEGTGIWKQDATFALLEPLDIQKHKDDDIPLYHKIGYDRLQRYQVLKQPAVLMYMALKPSRFGREEVKAAWDYYEPKTLHDSTLSFGIHALMASRIGKTEEAVSYFEKTIFLDLKDIMKNTAKEGIHAASLGGTWQAMVLGFGGLSVRDGQLIIEKRLPPQLKAVRYRIYFQGKRYRIDIRSDQLLPVITAEEVS